MAQAEEAQGIAAAGEVRPELALQVEEALTQYREGHARFLALREKQRAADRLTAVLERIPLPPPEIDFERKAPDTFSKPECVRRDAAYRQAFSAFGLPLDQLRADRPRSVEGFQGRPASWCAALDDWAQVQERLHPGDPTLRDQLLRFANAVDPEPLRRELRRLQLDGELSPARIARLLSAPRESKLVAATAITLVARLQRPQDEELALAVLREAQMHSPQDFLLTLRLGEHLRLARPPRHQEALRVFTQPRRCGPTTCTRCFCAAGRRASSGESRRRSQAISERCGWTTATASPT